MPNLLELSLDIKLLLLSYIDNRSLAHLSLTCTYFANLLKRFVSFRSAKVKLLENVIPETIDIMNYRAGVSIGSLFYMPLINESPICYTLDLLNHTRNSHSLNLLNIQQLKPQITSAVAVQSKIYLVCGRLLNSYTLSNAIIEIDTTNFNTRIIKNPTGTPPRPRHEHSVDAIDNRYLVVFGGLCYNSVGENDVFVYDVQENNWFVPPISGHVPHLRFGHASEVIGRSVYIHGGARLESDSSYVVYDDLYELDCETWTWFKYENPEVERYRYANRTTLQVYDHLIPTFGHSPHDRFQSFMCALGHKLVIFGGHSIREDDDDNEVVYNYSFDEISVFHTKRFTWSTIHTEIEGLDDLAVSDMSGAIVQQSGKNYIFIIAGQKPSDFSHWRGDDALSKHQNSSQQSSSSNSSHNEASTSQYGFLPSILEPHQSDSDLQNEGDDEEDDEELDRHQKDRISTRNAIEPPEGSEIETRGPSGTDESNQVERLFRMMDSDHLDDNTEPHGSNEHDHPKNESSTSFSSYSSGNNSLGKRKTKYTQQLKPLVIQIDLIE